MDKCHPECYRICYFRHNNSIRISLVHDFTQVRAGAIRLLRVILKNPRDVQTLNDLQIPQLVCRSIDIVQDNEEERVQAFKLVCSLDLKLMKNIFAYLVCLPLCCRSEGY